MNVGLIHTRDAFCVLCVMVVVELTQILIVVLRFINLKHGLSLFLAGFLHWIARYAWRRRLSEGGTNAISVSPVTVG